MPAYVSSTLSMATHNLVNMVAISAVSGAVVLAFWLPGIFEAYRIRLRVAASVRRPLSLAYIGMRVAPALQWDTQHSSFE